METEQVKPTLYIAIPANDTIFIDMMTSLMSLLAYTPAQCFVHRGSCLPEQRRRAVEHFLTTECSHLLFIDSDMTFPANAAERLLARQEAVVGVDYRKRRAPHTNVSGNVLRQVDTQLYAVAHVATGFLLIERSVFRRCPTPWFQQAWDVKANSFITEDVHFSRMCHRVGIETLVDLGLSAEVGHIASLPITLSTVLP